MTRLEFAEFLKKRRIEAGLSELEAARKLNLKSIRILRQWESGDLLPLSTMYKDLEECFRLTSGELKLALTAMYIVELNELL